MRRDDIPDDLRHLAFDFFYWFSRFEFALKEARFLKSKKVGAKAEADWDCFVAQYRGGYQPTPAAQALIDAKPQRQIVGETELDFCDVDPGTSDLERVVRLAQTVRNNLFHGGKHGSDYWDQPERMKTLLSTTITVLDELADMADLLSEYKRYY